MEHKDMQAIMFFNEHMIFAEGVLTEIEQAQLYAALRAYTMEGALPSLENRSREWIVIFNFMKASQDNYIKRYEETCERNRAAANIRWHKAT